MLLRGLINPDGGSSSQDGDFLNEEGTDIMQGTPSDPFYSVHNFFFHFSALLCVFRFCFYTFPVYPSSTASHHMHWRSQCAR